MAKVNKAEQYFLEQARRDVLDVLAEAQRRFNAAMHVEANSGSTVRERAKHMLAGVPFDGDSAAVHAALSQLAQNLLEGMLSRTKPGRSRDQAVLCLEQCMMWIGKAVRDDQRGSDG